MGIKYWPFEAWRFPKLYLNINFYLTENMLHLHYKDQPVNDI
jgi:hypothetical protein